jgi:predicted protein tyrosine phosphatase
MPEFTICGKSEVKKTVKRFGATHLVSTLDQGDRVFRPPRIPAQNHLQLWFDDEEDPSHTHAPRLHHAQVILDWGARLPSDARVVIHCAAGQCRSTAVGLALFLQANGVDQFDQARAWLWDHRPTACPNLLLAAHFDQLLNLEGTFVALCADVGKKGIKRLVKHGF